MYLAANIELVIIQGVTTNEKLITQKEKTRNNKLTINYDSGLESNVFPISEYHLQDFKILESSKAVFSVDVNTVLMQFCLNGGSASCQCKEGKGIVNFKNGECNILYLPKGTYHITAFQKEIGLLNVFLDEAFFFRHIPEDHPAYNVKKQNLLNTLFSKNLSINHRFKNVLKEIVHCEFDGHLKVLYLKAKIIELLILQLAQYEEEKTVDIKQEEIEKMTLVKELIESNFKEVYSLSYLARVAGTNEQYLKKHFKLLFGNTVFGYILAYKMQKANEMLLTGKYQITEVSEMVGYKHATHFTAAFKKFFGYLPSLVK